MKTQDFSQDDEAVSPVIGVILMVAITVILAAVIGTFVLNLGGSVQENVQAGASISCDAGDPGTVSVTWNSNQNADQLNITSWSIGNTANSTMTSKVLTEVGQSTTYIESDGVTTANNNEVSWVITAVAGESSTVVADDTCEI